MNKEYLDRLRLTDPVGYITAAVQWFGFERLFRRYYGIYRGKVIDNVDPENRGRCRIIIPSIGHQTEADVPADIYAIPCMTGLSVGNSRQVHGCFFPPDIGDEVFVTFESGLTNNPVFMGGWVHAGNANGPELRTQDASIKGIRTKYGHYISFNDTSGEIRIERGDGEGNPSGNVIRFDGPTIELIAQDGSNIVITTDTVTATGTDGSFVNVGKDAVELQNATGSRVAISGANAEISVAGSITLTAGATISVKAPQVNLGNGPSYEPAVMGQTFSTQYLTHTHASAAPTIPTSPQLGAPLVVASGLSIGVKVSI